MTGSKENEDEFVGNVSAEGASESNATQKKKEHNWLSKKDQKDNRVDGFSEWEDSKMLVPSSLELGTGTVEKYVISKQIVRMQEPRSLTPDDLDERRIVHPGSSNRALVNRFRDIRTKLLEVSGGNNFTLIVSGMGEGAGSSFMALNLAAAFAFDQSKTAVIIDCNLRKPTMHSTLDIIPETGLTNYLDGSDYDISKILYPTGIPRLRLIPAGSRREPAEEFFTTFRMKQLLKTVRRRYPDRFIILDTAPITESPDARILAELCDYAMLVVPHGRTTATAVERAASAFDTDKFVGAVING